MASPLRQSNPLHSSFAKSFLQYLSLSHSHSWLPCLGICTVHRPVTTRAFRADVPSLMGVYCLLFHHSCPSDGPRCHTASLARVQILRPIGSPYGSGISTRLFLFLLFFLVSLSLRWGKVWTFSKSQTETMEGFAVSIQCGQESSYHRGVLMFEFRIWGITPQVRGWIELDLFRLITNHNVVFIVHDTPKRSSFYLGFSKIFEKCHLHKSDWNLLLLLKLSTFHPVPCEMCHFSRSSFRVSSTIL